MLYYPKVKQLEDYINAQVELGISESTIIIQSLNKFRDSFSYNIIQQLIIKSKQKLGIPRNYNL